MTYLNLFIEFFRVGLFSIGGGMATIPFLKDISARTGWYSFAELADMIAVAESTPGPMGVNTATYVGFKTCAAQYGVAAGILGGVVATFGLVLPSLVVILIVAAFMEKFRQSKYVDAAFYGLRPASVGLISAAGISIMLIAFFGAGSVFDLTKGVEINVLQIALFVAILLLTNGPEKIKKLHPICFIGISALVGIILKM